MTLNVLVFGSSGFLSSYLLPHFQTKYGFKLTAFVRPGSKGVAFLKKHQIDIIEGKWDDEELIAKTVPIFDVVWEAGDSTDVAIPTRLIKAISENAKSTAYLRLSGTGNWISQSGGDADPSAHTYDDAKPEDIEAIHAQMFNGAGDLAALEGLKKGVNVWILCLGGVYGAVPKDVPSAGVFVRLFTNNALQLGYAPYIGTGTAHMQLIHIDDTVTATDSFLSQALPTIGKAPGHSAVNHQRYFIAPGYSVEWKHIAETWSRVLKDNLKLDIPVKNVPMSEAGFIAPLINADMKSKASRLEALGWTPRGPTIEETLPSVLVPGFKTPLV